MAESKFETLYYFMNEEVSLVEVKRTDLETEDLGQLLHWLKVVKATNEVVKMPFKSMNSEVVNGNTINIRVFENGELRFDDDFGKFLHDNDGHIIMNKPVNETPKDVLNSVGEFLQKQTT